MSQEQLGIGKKITSPQQKDAIHIAVIPAVAMEPVGAGDKVGILKNKDSEGRYVACIDDSTKFIGIVDPYLNTTINRGEQFWIFLYPGSITSLRHDWTHPDIVEEAPRPSGMKSRPITMYEPAWRIEDIVRMATEWRGKTRSDQIMGKDLLPILADAMEEAGYPIEKDILQLRKKYYEDALTNRIICILIGGELEKSVKWMDEFADRIDITFNYLFDCASRYMTAVNWKKTQTVSDESSYTYDGITTQDGSESWRNGLQGNEEVFWKHYGVIMNTDQENKGQFFSCSC